ncbi:MAG TPA: alpha/beta hydrolase [Paracoccaceae bacterium]|nr:alpha/beta hydrolase [Paracoccaceae bacterium]
MIEDWDDAYDNSGHIPGAEAYGPKWQAEAASFRAALGRRAELDIAYGGGARQRLDLFRPEGAPRGLVVFIHGGYWRSRDKSDWSHLAWGPLARGWAVAIPAYSLCPNATLPDIRREIARAVAHAAGRVPGPIRLTGHSAGGQLATRLLCDDLDLPFADRIARIVSISGVHDLRPLLRTAMAPVLRLDEVTATAESPALRRPCTGIPVTAWVGAAERPEFRRQAALIANIWWGLGVETTLVESPGEHHFSVVEALAEPMSPLVMALLDDRSAVVAAPPLAATATAAPAAALALQSRLRARRHRRNRPVRPPVTRPRRIRRGISRPKRPEA